MCLIAVLRVGNEAGASSNYHRSFYLSILFLHPSVLHFFRDMCWDTLLYIHWQHNCKHLLQHLSRRDWNVSNGRDENKCRFSSMSDLGPCLQRGETRAVFRQMFWYIHWQFHPYFNWSCLFNNITFYRNIALWLLSHYKKCGGDTT